MPSKLVRSHKSHYIGQFEIGMIFGGWKIASAVIWKSTKDRQPHVRCVCTRCNKTRRYVRIYDLLKSYDGCDSCAHSQMTVGPFSGKLIGRWRHSAFRRNILWELTGEQLLDLYNKQNGKCALTGESLIFPIKDKGGNVSLDRINSSMGYCATNVQLVTKNINFAKRSLEQTEFIELCRKVAYHNDAEII